MRRFLLLLCSVSALSACSSASDDEKPDGPWKYGKALPNEPQAGGDAVVGRRTLLEGSYMTCGIPWKVYEKFGSIVAGGLGAQGLETLPDRAGKNADLNFTINAFTAPDGTEVVNSNCLMCHGSHFDGELVIGLGNPSADFTAGVGGGAAGGGIPPAIIDALGLTDGEKAQMDSTFGRAAAVGPYSTMRTVGMNPAEMLAVVLMAHHDRDTLAWSDTEVTPIVVKDAYGEVIPDANVTSDPPPWWRAKKKHALFYNGMARGDHRGTMALATSVCVNDVPRAQEVDTMFRDIQAYVETVPAPVYKRAIDRGLADTGRKLFNTTCAGCHGHYDADSTNDAKDTYPNLLIPLDVIGTDPVVANAGVVHSPELVDWYNGSFYGQITQMVPNDPFPGYMPPPLDGVWATAPFFHNGSVPTIELVLNSSARPRYWKRTEFDTIYFDEEALGWPWAEVAYPQADAPADEKKYVYDTTYFSQSNDGHTFGDKLTPAERRAVLEYLKTL